MHPDWARSLRDQCTRAGVPFHFKQHGEFRELTLGDYDGAKPIRPTYTFPDELTVVRVGKHAAGRVLDGRFWDEYPAVTT
jgi:protein gp37